MPSSQSRERRFSQPRKRSRDRSYDRRGDDRRVNRDRRERGDDRDRRGHRNRHCARPEDRRERNRDDRKRDGAHKDVDNRQQRSFTFKRRQYTRGNATSTRNQSSPPAVPKVKNNTALDNKNTVDNAHGPPVDRNGTFQLLPPMENLNLPPLGAGMHSLPKAPTFPMAGGLIGDGVIEFPPMPGVTQIPQGDFLSSMMEYQKNLVTQEKSSSDVPKSSSSFVLGANISLSDVEEKFLRPKGAKIFG